MANSPLQKTAASFANSASAQTLQYTSNVTAGSLLVVAIAAGGNSGASFTVSDDKNGSWTQADSTHQNGAKSISVFYFKNSGGAGTKPTVSVTPNASATITLLIHEYGVTSPTGVSVDGAVSATGASGAAMSPGSLPVAGAGEVAFACSCWTATAATGASGGGFTFEQAISTNTFGVTADDVAAGSAETCTFIPNPGSSWVAMAVSFITGAAASRQQTLTTLGCGA